LGAESYVTEMLLQNPHLITYIWTGQPG